MRDIKFRWFVEDEFVYTDKITEYDFDCFITIENGEICLNCESGDDDFIGMKYDKADNKTRGQFTGLKDVNGVEIYEGDIVKRTYSVWPNKKTFSVVLVAELSCSTFDDDIGGGQDYEENTLKLEVIGNIHQNPELLEK